MIGWFYHKWECLRIVEILFFLQNQVASFGGGSLYQIRWLQNKLKPSNPCGNTDFLKIQSAAVYKSPKLPFHSQRRAAAPYISCQRKKFVWFYRIYFFCAGNISCFLQVYFAQSVLAEHADFFWIRAHHNSLEHAFRRNPKFFCRTPSRSQFKSVFFIIVVFFCFLRKFHRVQNPHGVCLFHKIFRPFNKIRFKNIAFLRIAKQISYIKD